MTNGMERKQNLVYNWSCVFVVVEYRSIEGENIKNILWLFTHVMINIYTNVSFFYYKTNEWQWANFNKVIDAVIYLVLCNHKAVSMNYMLVMTQLFCINVYAYRCRSVIAKLTFVFKIHNQSTVINIWFTFQHLQKYLILMHFEGLMQK